VSSVSTTFDFVQTTSFVAPARVDRFGIALIQLHDQLWRVTRKSGEVLGYIESFAQDAEVRFKAKRMFSAGRPSMPLGEFWTIDDAIDCFRFS
jgi:hypothetical protein